MAIVCILCEQLVWDGWRISEVSGSCVWRSEELLEVTDTCFSEAFEASNQLTPRAELSVCGDPQCFVFWLRIRTAARTTGSSS